MKINSDKLSVQVGRLSLVIIVLGFVTLKILGKSVYNGLDGVTPDEKVFLLWIIVGGVIGAYAYALKKTVSSVVALIISVVVVTSALGMQLHKSSNQQVDPIVKTPIDEVEAQGTQGHP